MAARSAAGYLAVMIVYLNGEFVERKSAMIHAEDRGFLFGDGVYEVTRFYGGSPLAMDMHMGRLRKGLAFLGIDCPDAAKLDAVSCELIERNDTPDAAVYWQVTRGSSPRAFGFPDPPVEPTVFAIAYPAHPLRRDEPVHTLTAITQPDDRWAHCEVKTVQLLPNVLASQVAHESNVDMAILTRDDWVTEATSRSILVVEGGAIATYPLDGRILDSITRRIVLELARENDIAVDENPATIERLFAADEVIAVGSTTEVAAVTQINGRAIADSAVGPITAQLFEWYKTKVFADCGLAE